MDETKGYGWVLFAAIMLFVAGTMAIINGSIAIWNGAAIDNLGADYVASNLSTWGWAALIMGILGVVAGFSVLRGGLYGIWFAVVVAALNMIVQLFWIPIVPFWALTIMLIDVLVIYNLVVYGRNFKTE
jgi:hypothetical protein